MKLSLALCILVYLLQPDLTFSGVFWKNGRWHSTGGIDRFLDPDRKFCVGPCSDETVSDYLWRLATEKSKKYQWNRGNRRSSVSSSSLPDQKSASDGGSAASSQETGRTGDMPEVSRGDKVAKRYSYPKSARYSNTRTNSNSHIPGYHTAWGTNFTGSHVYTQQLGNKSRVLDKAVGLGVAPGFVGGAAEGAAGTVAAYSVFHRYQMFKKMAQLRGLGYSDDLTDDWYQNYTRNICKFGCPKNSHCEWGFCECDFGFNRRYGQCVRRELTPRPRHQNFHPFVDCSSYEDCQKVDINMVCNSNTSLTVRQSIGSCECKRDMKWNRDAGECQLFIDVDCSAITYETPPSQTILNAVAKAQAQTKKTQSPNSQVSNRLSTPTIEESLNASLLIWIDSENATALEMREAFCRDVDTFSIDFQMDKNMVDTNIPADCNPSPSNACGIVYDSADCSGGWKLVIFKWEETYPYFTSLWRRRDGIDLVAVSPGCTLTAYNDTAYTQPAATFSAPKTSEYWWLLMEYEEFQNLDQSIQSIKCVC